MPRQRERVRGVASASRCGFVLDFERNGREQGLAEAVGAVESDHRLRLLTEQPPPESLGAGLVRSCRGDHDGIEILQPGPSFGQDFEVCGVAQHCKGRPVGKDVGAPLGSNHEGVAHALPGFLIPGGLRRHSARLPEVEFPHVSAGVVPTRQEWRFRASDRRECGRSGLGLVNSPNRRWVFGRTRDHETVAHEGDAIPSVTGAHELELGVGSVDQDEVRVPATTQCQGLARADGQHLDLEVRILLLEYRDQGIQQARVVHRRGRSEVDHAIGPIRAARQDRDERDEGGPARQEFNHDEASARVQEDWVACPSSGCRPGRSSPLPTRAPAWPREAGRPQAPTAREVRVTPRFASASGSD